MIQLFRTIDKRPLDGRVMKFEETDEQTMIRELVRDFAESVLTPTVLERDREQRPPTEEWAQFIEYGLHTLSLIHI